MIFLAASLFMTGIMLPITRWGYGFGAELHGASAQPSLRHVSCGARPAPPSGSKPARTLCAIAPIRQESVRRVLGTGRGC